MTISCVRIVQGSGLVLLSWIWLVTSAMAAHSTWQQEQLLQEPIFNGNFLLREAGSDNADILLLIHGLGDEAADIWEPFVAELADRFHVVAPDLPGFGGSTRANQLYSPANYAEFIHWLLGRYPGKTVYLAGHSLGGAIALNVAARYGERLERLILIDAAGTLHRLAVSQSVIRDLIRLELPFFSTTVESHLGQIAGMILETTSQVLMDPDLILANAAARESFLSGDPTQIAALALVQSDFSLVLPRVTTPTWLIWGDQDQIAPVRIATLLDWNLAKSHLTLLSGLGHLPMSEDPQKFLTALRQALFAEMDDNNFTAAAQTPVDAICDNQQGRVFSGHFEKLQIHNCTGVLIIDAQVAQLTTVDSQVTIEHSSVGNDSGQVAIQTRRSNLTLTGVDIRGNIGIQVDQGRLDMAGVRFFETPVAVMGVGHPSSLLFSSSFKQVDGMIMPLQVSRSLRQGESL